MKSLRIALLGFALASGAAAHAAEKDWKGLPLTFEQSSCTLQLVSLSQPNDGQPLHLTVVNKSGGRVKYTMRARVVRQNMPEFNGVIRVDNANAGEVSERPTVNALSGALGKGAVKVSLVNCSVLS